MPQVKEYVYPGVGERNKRDYHYSQALRVGAMIEVAGQGGWDPQADTLVFPKDINEQIDQAFRNVNLAIRTAGGKGWEQVIKITSYHIPLDDDQLGAMVRNMKQWMPNNHPPWTCIETSRLGGGPDMRVEIQVTAWDEEGAEK